MKSSGNLKLSERLKVGGRVSLRGELYADEVRIGGKLSARKVDVVKLIETNTLKTRDGAKAARIEIGVRGEAYGPLVGSNVIIKSRARVDDIFGDEVNLQSHVIAGRVYGRKVRIESRCDVEEVTYTESLRADSSVRFRVPPQKTEKLPEPPL